MIVSKADPQAVVATLKGCLGSPEKAVELHEPCFEGNEWKYVKECLDTGWVSSVGKFVTRFEKDLAELAGAKRGVAVVNGTAALHIALKVIGVEAGDEVLVPTLTFVGTTNAIAHCGATPHFVDSEAKTLGVDPIKLDQHLAKIAKTGADGTYNKSTGQRIRALVVVHIMGHPADLDALQDVCDKYNIVLVEDAAESIGSLYKGKHTGTFGKVAVLSFNGNKTITTGGGGAILTNDEKLADLAKHLTTTAKSAHQWRFYHDTVAYNYRLPNINAALGCAQLESLPGFLKRKRALATRYQKAFSGLEGLKFFSEPEFATSNYWLNAIILDEGDMELRDAILSRTNENGLHTRPVWEPMHTLPMYDKCPRADLSTAERLHASLINIPSSANLVTTA
jgi:perosamine synthetase